MAETRVAVVLSDLPGDGLCPSKSLKSVAAAALTLTSGAAKDLKSPGSMGRCSATAHTKLDSKLADAGACAASTIASHLDESCRDPFVAALPIVEP